MSRRLFRILTSLGLSTFFLFLLTSTSLPAVAHTISGRSHLVVHTVLNKTHHSVTSPKVNTSVQCQALNLSSGWTQTRNGPAGFGCGGNAWQTTTPTSAFAQYDFGLVYGAARYHFNAFITNQANAPMNYDIYTGSGSKVTHSCFYNQNLGIAWKTVCSFTVSDADSFYPIEIMEWSGAVHSFIMSSSAVQLIQY